MLPQPATSSFASAILQCAPRLRALRVGLAEPPGLQRSCRAPAQVLETARELAPLAVGERGRPRRERLAAAYAHLGQRRLEAGERGAEAAAATVELARGAEVLQHLGIAMHQGGVAVAAHAERALPFAWHRVARSGDDSVGQRIARPVAVPVVPGPSASAAGRREQIEDEIWVAGVNRKIAAP